MTSRPGDEGLEVPTSSDAARILREIRPVTRRSRRLTRDAALARPLLAWGLAWMAGALLFEYLPEPAGAICGSLPCAGALAACWLARSPHVRLPGRRRFTALWFALLAVSPLLVAVAAPPNARLMVLFLASLWGLGMVLWGIGTQDAPLALVGLGVVALAGAGRIAFPGAAMLAVGLGGGLAMASLGGWRTRWRRS